MPKITKNEDGTDDRWYPIPGTNWRIGRYIHGLMLSELREVRIKDKETKQKLGETKMDWSSIVYPVDFKHAAEIIGRSVGEGPIVDILQQIIVEQEKLTKILEQLVAKSGVPSKKED